MKQAWLAAIFLLLPAVARADDRAEENDVLVHLDGPPAASLEQLEGSEWVWKCAVPCDLRVGRTDRYRVAGKGIHESDPFQLIADPGSDETIHVRASSKARAATGAIVFLTGLVGAVSGLIMIEVAKANNDCDRDVTAFGYDEPPCHSYDGLRYAGIGIGIGGLINVAVGALVYSSHLSSTLTQSLGTDRAARFQFFPMRTLATNGERQPNATSAVPGAVTSALFSFSF